MTEVDLSAEWEANAGNWIKWARTAGLDAAFWEINAPMIRELLPDAGSASVDVGCGEGRVGRLMSELGHRVHGLDSSQTLAEAAREAGGYVEVQHGDATALPWDAGSFDVAMAFMCLMDMPDPDGAVREIARVLVPGGRAYIGITHPLTGTEEFLTDYFTEREFDETAVIGGVAMRFVGRERPIERYTRALADAGFVIEMFREPCPTLEAVQRAPRLAAARRRPWSLHIVARRD